MEYLTSGDEIDLCSSSPLILIDGNIESTLDSVWGLELDRALPVIGIGWSDSIGACSLTTTILGVICVWCCEMLELCCWCRIVCSSSSILIMDSARSMKCAVEVIDEEEADIMLCAPVSEMPPNGSIRFWLSEDVVGYESCRCNEWWCDPPVTLGRSSDDWLGSRRGCECCLMRNGVWVDEDDGVVLRVDSGTVSKCVEELDVGPDWW